MATHKSSITAELKLSGRAKFRSDLGAAEQDAKGAAGRMSAIKPVSIGIDAKGAGRQMTMVEEKHRAHRRVIERQEKESAKRMAAYNAAGVGGGGGRSAGRQGAGIRRASMAYNFGQDYIQGGGIRGVANNIPQVAEEIASSPGLKAAAAAAAAAVAVAYAAKLGYDLYQSTGDRFEKNAGKRYELNRKGSDEKRRKIAQELAEVRAQKQGEVSSAGQSGLSKSADFNISRLDQGTEGRLGDSARKASLRSQEISQIENESARRTAAADEEKRVLIETYGIKKAAAQESVRISNEEVRASELKFQQAKKELQGITKAARTQEDRSKAIKLTGELAGIEERMFAARERASKSGAQMQEVRLLEQELVVQKKLIDERKKFEDQQIQKAKDQDATEGRIAYAQQIGQIQQAKRATDKSIKDEEKGRQATRDQINGASEKYGMSPRRRAKFEEKERIKADTEEFKSQKFGPTEAAKLANQKNDLFKKEAVDADRAAKGLRPRIRGAGFKGDDSKRKSGLGSASYDGLAGLAAMQDDMVSPSAPQERKRIGGAGRDKEKIKDREKQQGDSATGIWNQILAGLKSVEKAVRDTGPSSNDRGKPLSVVNR